MAKLKREHISTFQVDGQLSNYLVTLKPLKNTYYGNPRFEATIIDLNNFNYSAWQYKFTGHYMGRQEECEWVVAQHENVVA